jgi:hypothetical protein
MTDTLADQTLDLSLVLWSADRSPVLEESATLALRAKPHQARPRIREALERMLFALEEVERQQAEGVP